MRIYLTSMNRNSDNLFAKCKIRVDVEIVHKSLEGSLNGNEKFLANNIWSIEVAKASINWILW